MNAVKEGNKLSPRELEVAVRIAQGKGNKQIAKELCIGESTVKNYVRSIFIKGRFSSRLQVGLKYSCLINLGAGI